MCQLPSVPCRRGKMDFPSIRNCLSLLLQPLATLPSGSLDSEASYLSSEYSQAIICNQESSKLILKQRETHNTLQSRPIHATLLVCNTVLRVQKIQFSYIVSGARASLPQKRNIMQGYTSTCLFLLHFLCLVLCTLALPATEQYSDLFCQYCFGLREMPAGSSKGSGQNPELAQ